MQKQQLWERYKNLLYHDAELELSVDTSRIDFPEGFLEKMDPRLQQAYQEMEALEQGAVANPDEHRMVGHYWLRAPELAPEATLAEEITSTLAAIEAFASSVHGGNIAAPDGHRFTDLLIIGIGGSALGPQFLADSLGGPKDLLRIWFFDNTDPDGMDKVLSGIGAALKQTLVVVISKSGGTKETRNGMLEACQAFERAGLHFAGHAVAVTGSGSELDRTASRENWLGVFPMWDWVGGRTSVTSAVGLLPAALQGIDVDRLLAGARACDQKTRSRVTRENPAALLALSWFHATQGKGTRDMVLLPYKDRLLLFSRYLQQLIMESLGKGLDRDGKEVLQGIAVYGNKGSTDQHAYVQQLREGVHNFFVTFIEVLKDRQGPSMEVEPGATSGDYLSGFFQGTRSALYEKGRESVTITVRELSPASIGALIALYERAVGLYASLVNVNAYHQPGVEAGKEAAGAVLKLQGEIMELLRRQPNRDFTGEEMALALARPEEVETTFMILRHLAANGDHGVSVTEKDKIWENKYRSKD
ncbi:glucose-6-phosphate isomerase [Citrifermentans bemidjiense Bem]|uniref:Glucose-6-phosphate isomerase n=1 Tax=Citrifermentans bemidjiense (strain ATCC BAA-1014 / DSM 16622 / JCM 12645 / Bem) TaxID=404380 RepID=G6PI_CITBB|nr:glucose-6-phosphate isomerase [Citrifermentans bemidjiense]B5EBB8.1 RecName: Full=Glucose-6-phosphate isomerase; Short=GPI; AltName: Full=Phosphoglucose isomerase; Short=PGI; AltName: Full=Phosphohexose isomerase; Short=PHI [Citrifermentans bemidjiense Bem]ACH40410.1 glucose-6-phosphate isomerase [Citrifermentans bemidjiense Bem]